MKDKERDEYTPEETARRMEATIRRAFQMPHKPMKQFVGTTDRAKAMARRKIAKRRPAAKG